MRVWTYGEARKKVMKDLDMDDEQFVTPTEMLGYFNEAIDEAEAEILKINEDYLLTSDRVTLVSGTADYALPADTYAAKLRALVYENGTRIYQLHRIKNLQKFMQIQFGNYQPSTTDEYQFFIKNPSASLGFQMQLVPPAQENGELITRWYIRNAARVAVDADPIDIPEFTNFVITYVKAMCRAKENGGDLMPTDVVKLEQQRKMMVDTLTEMVPDDENQLPMDTSSYEEMS